VPRKVTALHLNRDTDLTDVTVTDAHGNKAVVHTTQHHLFWDLTRHTWIDAAQLPTGDVIQTLDGTPATIGGVHSFTNAHLMYDLTVDVTHTYYVVAGNTPVLVHNSCKFELPGDVPREKWTAETRMPKDDHLYPDYHTYAGGPPDLSAVPKYRAVLYTIIHIFGGGAPPQ